MSNETSNQTADAPAVASGDLLEDAADDFPPVARAFLKAFYDAKSAITPEQKIAALRSWKQLEHATVTGQGTPDELKVLEFYTLAHAGIL